MVHGMDRGMVQSSLRTRSWMSAGIVGLMLLVALFLSGSLGAACIANRKRDNM